MADSANLGSLDTFPDASASTQTAFLPSLDSISGNEASDESGDESGDVSGTQLQYGEFAMVALAQSEFHGIHLTYSSQILILLDWKS